MNTNEIEYALRKNRILQGVYAADELPTENYIRPALFISNTQESCLPGEHWIAIYFPPTGPAEFFDSFGRKPFKEVFRKLLGYPYIYNKRVVQSLTSDRCGFHVIHYAKQRSSGVPMKQILKQYSNNLDENDAFVTYNK